MNKDCLEYKLFLIAVGCDYVFNQGKLFKSAVHCFLEYQRQKEEKLKSLDNDCFGC